MKNPIRERLWKLSGLAIAPSILLGITGLALPYHREQLFDVAFALALPMLLAQVALLRSKALSVPALRSALNTNAGWAARAAFPSALWVSGLALALAGGGAITKMPYSKYLLVAAGGVGTTSLIALAGYLWILAVAIRKVRLALSNRNSLGPPRIAKFVLLLVPARDREHLLGDLEEEYFSIVLPEYGSRAAWLWYWWQVIASVVPFLYSRLAQVAAISWLWKRSH